MNNERRKRIREIIKSAEDLKSEINIVLDDEQYAYDNMTDGLQCSERGINSEESIESLENAIESIEECINNLSDIN